MLDATSCALLVAVLLTGLAAIIDLRTGLIPNRLVVVGAIATLGMTCVWGAAEGTVGLLRALLGMLLGLVLVSLVPGVLYWLGGIGGGDVKLLAVVGALLGPSMGLEAELYAFAVAVLYAPARLLWEGKLLSSMRTIGQLVVRPFVRRKEPPPALEQMTSFRFGPAIFVGTLAVAALRMGGVA